MKSIITSVSPYLCEKIVSDDCKILVKKSASKEVPFKCYIYCTKMRKKADLITKSEKFGRIMCSARALFNRAEEYDANGKVIGEFICDKVDNFYCVSVPYQRENNLGYGQFIDNGVYKVNNWHEGIAFERNDRYIDTMLNNYDLKEMCLSAQELFDYIGVGKHLYAWHIADLKIYDKPKELSEFRTPKNPHRIGNSHSWILDGYKQIKQPPTSWQYVEEIS